jgi:hypothetical protein
MFKNPCFFGSKYSGEKCVCGWESKMEKELPVGYYPSNNGIIKLFVHNTYDTPQRPATTYSCIRKNAVKRRKSQEPFPKHPTFIVYHDTNRILPKGAWSKTIKKYLQYALVNKGQKASLICMGVAPQEEEVEKGVI